MCSNTLLTIRETETLMSNDLYIQIKDIYLVTISQLLIINVSHKTTP